MPCCARRPEPTCPEAASETPEPTSWRRNSRGIEPETRGPDDAALRRTLGGFVTGVTVVTARGSDGAAFGFTANSFTAVSLAPPLVLVCVGDAVQGVETFRTCGRFAISILSDSQRALSRSFADDAPNLFPATDWRDGPHGSPILRDGLGWLECAAERRIDAGDHMILVGRVLAHECSDRRPLVYYRGGYASLGSEGRSEGARPGDAASGARKP